MPNPCKLLSAIAGRLPGLAIGVSVLSMLTTIGLLGDLSGQIRLSGGYVEISNDNLTRFVGMVTMVACSIGFLLVQSSRGFRIILLIKIGFFTLFLVAGTGSTIADLALTTVFLIEIAIYEAFFLNLILGLLLIVATQIILFLKQLDPSVLSQPGNSFWHFLASVLFPGLVVCLASVLAASLMIYHREKSINLVNRVTQLESVITKLSATNLGYQHYAEDAGLKSQLEERLRITRELHDVVGYTFTNNIMMMEAAITRIHKDPDRVQELINLARQNAETGLEKIRTTLYMLRSSTTPDLSLRERMARMVDVFQVATAVRVQLDFGNVPDHLNRERELFAYFFVQEALTNAFLHGAATQVQVRFFMSASSLGVSVSDNGCGAEHIGEGIGLSGMRERLEPLHGRLTFQNTPLGFEIMAEFPYRQNMDHSLTSESPSVTRESD